MLQVLKLRKTSWFCNNLANYQFFLGGEPTPASPVNVRIGFSENIAELARALHFGHKSADGNFPSLYKDNGTYMEQNFVLGQEFESFCQKGPVIQSGINNSHSGATQNGNNEACYLKLFCLYDTFLYHSWYKLQCTKIYSSVGIFVKLNS